MEGNYSTGTVGKKTRGRIYKRHRIIVVKRIERGASKPGRGGFSSKRGPEKTNEFRRKKDTA